MKKRLLGLTMMIPLSLGTAHAAPILLEVAGGGGGAGNTAAGTNGQLGTSGTSGTSAVGGAGGTMGAGGGGGTGVVNNGGGGAGLLSAGGTGPGSGSGTGGMTAPTYSGGSGLTTGGFGGGGGGGALGGGGGGGYSGGGGGGGAYGNNNNLFNGGGGGGGGSFLGSALTSISGLSAAPGSTSLSNNAASGFVAISLVGASNSTQIFNYSGATEDYTFATTGLYSIVAAGGQGGDADGGVGGLGAEVGGTAMFTADSMLELVVGGGGGTGVFTNNGGGGGGGSFVFETYVAPAPVTTTVPEPVSLALLGTGLVGLVVARRRCGPV